MAEVIVEELSQDKHKLETLTFDNDMAFSKHELIAQSLMWMPISLVPILVRIKGQLKIGLG